MHYILFVSLDHFYIDAIERSKPQLKQEAVIVHRDKAVLDCNRLALRSGAQIGMGLSEAKALLRGAHLISWEEDLFRAFQKRWLDICTVFSDVVEPDEQDSVFMDLSGHPDPVLIAWRLQEEIRSSLGLQSSAGLASTKWIAKIAAGEQRRGEVSQALLEACEAPASFLRDLKTKCLLPIAEATRVRLSFLGYSRIGEVAEIPLHILQEQFGDEGFLIHQAARGGVLQKVSANYPEASIADRFRFVGGADTQQEFEVGISHVAGSLSTNLLGKDLQGSELYVTINLEEKETRKLHRRFMKPLQSKRSIYSGILLITAGEIRDRVLELRVQMPNLKATERFQRELTGAHSQKERANSASAAFAHIRTVFGDSAIAVAGQLAEPRRKQLLRVWKDATGWS
jgi:DNA polymerase-4